MKHSFIYFIASFVLLLGCKKEEQVLPKQYGIVADIDGNEYKTVKIGDQWWMAENLRVSHFQDGSELSYVPYSLNDDTLWSNLQGAAYTYVNDSLFGKLYNFDAVRDARKLAPVGWHIATDEDWKTLEQELGMNANDVPSTGWRGENQADMITSEFNVGWQASSSDESLYGSNTSGFSALPGGVRTMWGYTNIQGNTAFWWAPAFGPDSASYRYIDIMTKRIFRQHIHPGYGMSVRCVKD